MAKRFFTIAARAVTLASAALGLVAVAVAARADPPDLKIPVYNPGPGVSYLGQIVVHATVGAIGKDRTGSTGFTPDPNLGDGSLGAAAQGSGETGFNWLQIVTAQPAREDPEFGATPHVDPSLTYNGKKNPQSNGQPWYSFGKSLPPLSATFLPFSDLPTLRPGDTIAFDTYLVSFFPDHEYDVLAGFSWSDTGTPKGQPNTVTFQAITGFSEAYQQLVHSYGTTGWSYHEFGSGGGGMPEPGVWWLMIVGVAAVGASARRTGRRLKALEE